MPPISKDAIIIGAGAAGLFAAFQAAQRGMKVLVLEKQSRAGLKILISGGGRCNFTNLHVTPGDYNSNNPHFCKSALSRYQPADFIRLVQNHGIAYHEKERGQLFCDHSSKDIVNMLLAQCRNVSASIQYNCLIQSIQKVESQFFVKTGEKVFSSPNLVIATGGLSFNNLGATDFGYLLAKQFGHSIIEPYPALTPIIWSQQDLAKWKGLAGLSCPVRVKTGKITEEDDLLFTHNGLSGPAILRTTLHWENRSPIMINFSPRTDLYTLLKAAKEKNSKALPKNWLAQYLPTRLAQTFSEELMATKAINQLSFKQLDQLAGRVHSFFFTPAESAGYSKAEVTGGGIDTREISSKSMESQRCRGLYFIGELLDVTGDLGGFNFHWAWASAFAAATAIQK